MSIWIKTKDRRNPKKFYWVSLDIHMTFVMALFVLAIGVLLPYIKPLFVILREFFQ
jgi:hypothetical protein